MLQIIISLIPVIIDSITSLLNLVGSVKGFKNENNPPMIIEKTMSFVQ